MPVVVVALDVGVSEVKQEFHDSQEGALRGCLRDRAIGSRLLLLRGDTGNPAFLLHRMATEHAYRLNWPSGESNLLIVSIGTGTAESLGGTSAALNRNIVSTVSGIPGDLMYGMSMDQDINCRTIGRCTYGALLDREILDLVPRQITDGMSVDEQWSAPLVPLTTDLGRRFLYARYSADLSRKGLDALGLPEIDADKIQKMDGVENISALMEIGQAARKEVNMVHLGLFVQSK